MISSKKKYESSGRFSKNRWLYAGIIVIVLLFAFLQTQRAYFFTRDDNLVQFLPVLNEAQSQLMDGHLPALNMHQYMGSPILRMGTYAVLYPPMVLSYLISHYLLEDDFALLEVFALLHLLAGYLFTYVLLRHLKVNSLYSFIGGLSFVLSGYAIVYIPAWYYVAPCMVFIPLLTYLQYRLNNECNAKIIALSAISRALFFYGGNVQYFVYWLMFETILFAYLFTKTNSRSKYLESNFISLLITIILVLPLGLLIAANAADSYERSEHFLDISGLNPHEGVLGMLFPAPISYTTHHLGWDSPYESQVFYFGSVIMFALVIGLLLCIKMYGKKSWKKVPIFFYLGVLSLWLSMGYKGGLYLLTILVPVLNKFRYPLKFTLFTTFFFIVAGVIFLYWLVKKLDHQKRRRVSLIIVVVFFLLIVYHLFLCSKLGIVVVGEGPPEIIDDYFERNSGRVITVFSDETIDKWYAEMREVPEDFKFGRWLNSNFATYFGYYHYSGYEPLRSKQTANAIGVGAYARIKKLNKTKLNFHGVRYVIVPEEERYKFRSLEGMPITYANENLLVLENQGAKPFVFSENQKINIGEIKFLHNGLSFNVSAKQIGNVTINLLAHPQYEIRVDGKKTIFEADKYERINVVVPAGNYEVIVEYKEKIFWVISGISVILLALVMLYFRFFRAKSLVVFSRSLVIIQKVLQKIPKKRWMSITIVVVFIAGLLSFLRLLYLLPHNPELFALVKEYSPFLYGLLSDLINNIS